MFDYTNNRETVYAWFTFSHWLVYANSAANPIIYNFLSGKTFSLSIHFYISVSNVIQIDFVKMEKIENG